LLGNKIKYGYEYVSEACSKSGQINLKTMKKLKSVIIAVVLIVVLHFITVLSLSGVKIFPCQTKPVVADMEKVEWKDGVCDVNYKNWIGSAQRLSPGASAARVGLIYVLPVLITATIMYGLHLRKRRVGMTTN